MSKASTNGSPAPTADKFQGGGRSSTRWLTATALTVTALIVSVTIASATPTKSDPQTPSSADTQTTLTTSNGTKVTPLGSGQMAVSQPIWNNNYPLGRSGQGVVGVHADKSQTPKPHLYGLQANLGNTPGWWIWLTGGSPDDQYISGAVEWTYKSPGTTRLKTAVLDLSARPKIYRADHCSELGLRTLPSSSTTAQTIDSLRECNPPEDVPGVDGWQTRTLTFQDPAANPSSKELFFRLEFPACKNPPTNGEPSCSKHIPELDPLTNGFAARMDRLEMILVDDDLPTVTPSGEFYALKDTYIDGKGTYSLKIDADDKGAGIKQIGFDHQGNAVTEGANGALGTIHDHASPCDPAHNTQSLDNRICPQADATSTTVDTNPMPEGNNSFEAWAKDPAENRGTSSFKVKIDRTPPPAPPNPKFLTPEDGIAQIGWDESVDPALIDATPGSGTASYRVRYAQDYTPFSDWKTYPADARVSDWTPEYPIGTWVTLEVVAVDAVGNVSPASSVHGQVIALPPVVTASGAFYDLDDEYINGQGTYAANVSAVDTGSGVRSVSVHEYMVGDQMTSLAPCTTDLLLVETCPKEYGADFSVSTTGLAEGAHVFVGKAVDRLGAVGSTEGTRVLVDRTAPKGPSGMHVRELSGNTEDETDDDSDDFEVVWTGAFDPNAPDGTPGSGIDSFRYRHAIGGGAFSGWKKSVDSSAVLTATIGSTFELDVQTTDDVGHVSTVRLDGKRSAPQLGSLAITVHYDNGDKISTADEPSAAGVQVTVDGQKVGETPEQGPLVVATTVGTHTVSVVDLDPAVTPSGGAAVMEVTANNTTIVDLGIFDYFRSNPGSLGAMADQYAPVLIHRKDEPYWPTSVSILEKMAGDSDHNPVDAGARCWDTSLLCTQMVWCRMSDCRIWGIPPRMHSDTNYRGDDHLKYYATPRPKRHNLALNNPFDGGDNAKQVAGFNKYAWRVPLSKSGAINDTTRTYYVLGGGREPHYENGVRYETFTLQYWMFYTFNHYVVNNGPDWNHEGDWEEVAVRFVIRGNGNFQPMTAIFERHGKHKRFKWTSSKVHKKDGQLKVFVAGQGHGNYETCGKFPRGGLPDDHAAPCDDQDSSERIEVCHGGCDVNYPLSPINHQGWGCFRGVWGPNDHFPTGEAPFSPLQQQGYYGAGLC